MATRIKRYETEEDKLDQLLLRISNEMGPQARLEMRQFKRDALFGVLGGKRMVEVTATLDLGELESAPTGSMFGDKPTQPAVGAAAGNDPLAPATARLSAGDAAAPMPAASSAPATAAPTAVAPPAKISPARPAPPTRQESGPIAIDEVDSVAFALVASGLSGEGEAAAGSPARLDAQSAAAYLPGALAEEVAAAAQSVPVAAEPEPEVPTVAEQVEEVETVAEAAQPYGAAQTVEPLGVEAGVPLEALDAPPAPSQADDDMGDDFGIHSFDYGLRRDTPDQPPAAEPQTFSWETTPQLEPGPEAAIEPSQEEEPLPVSQADTAPDFFGAVQRMTIESEHEVEPEPAAAEVDEQEIEPQAWAAPEEPAADGQLGDAPEHEAAVAAGATAAVIYETPVMQDLEPAAQPDEEVLTAPASSAEPVLSEEPVAAAEEPSWSFQPALPPEPSEAAIELSDSIDIAPAPETVAEESLPAMDIEMPEQSLTAPVIRGLDAEPLAAETMPVAPMDQTSFHMPGMGSGSAGQEAYEVLLDWNIGHADALALLQSAHDAITPGAAHDMGALLAAVGDQICRAVRFGGGIELGRTPPGKVVALVGPTGVGKTTTLAKLAAMFAFEQDKQVSLLSLDNYRIAATEQLRTYAEIAGMELDVVFNGEEFRTAVQARRPDHDLLLADTAGRSPNNPKQLTDLASVLTAQPPDEVHLVVSAGTRRDDLRQILEVFSPFGCKSVILTKLDETRSLGALYNLSRLSSLPISYFTVGQAVPEDIQAASLSFVQQWIASRRII